MLTVLVTVLLSIIWVDCVHEVYEVEVTVHSYRNPTGRCDECQEDNNPDPGCCDEEAIRPIDEDCPILCDTAMIICFRPVDSIVELTGISCQSPNNRTGTQLFDNTNSLEFSVELFGITNPLVLFSALAWVGLQILYVIVECSPAQLQGANCVIMQRIDAIPVDIDITVGTASSETTYIGIAGIAQLNVSFLVRCADGFYGQDCLTTCPNFESCAGCGLSGFTGEFCQFSTEDCSEVYCNGNGDCVVGSPICDCNPGFTGDLCQVNIDDCEGVSCNNSGECIDQIDGFACECDPGFTGNLCQHDIDYCEDVNCNDGRCVDGVNGFTCECNPGFFGETCENTNHCFSITCSGTGRCENLRDAFTCNCEAGYTGNLCQVETIVDSAGASVGAIAGGVIGALIAVVVLAIIIVMVIIFALSRARARGSEGGNFGGNGVKERDGTISSRDNPAYGVQEHAAIDNPAYDTQQHAIDNSAYGAQAPTLPALDASVQDRECENPIYSSNIETEDPYTVPPESPSPPNVYDRVGPRVLEENEVYYSSVAT